MGEIEVLNLGTTQRRVLITVVDQCCRSKFCAVIEDKATRGIKGSSPNLPPLSLKSITYSTMMKLGTLTPCLKKIKKNI